MRSLRYLNTILTLLTVLLALQLWTVWTAPIPAPGSALGSDQSLAQAFPLTSEAYAAGIPNAGQQRKEMINLLKKQTQRIDELVAMFKSGEARIRVEAGKGVDE